MSLSIRLSFLALYAMAILLVSCRESQHNVVATNIKLPNWEAAGAGLMRAAGQMQVKARFVGPNTSTRKRDRRSFKKFLPKNRPGS